jgi:hypothetical protein
MGTINRLRFAHRGRVAGLGFDDDDAAVLVQHADGLPDLPQARRSGARPGTAQPSRRLEQDEHGVCLMIAHQGGGE